MSYGLLVPLVHLVVAAPVLYYAGWCLKTGKKCKPGFADLLMALALGVAIYHLYKLLVRVGVLEGFVQQGGYLGRPMEPFVPFSFPYHKETDRYYSFHDNQHTRNCNCQHKDGHSGCHATCSCGQTPCVCGCGSNEGFDNVSPVDNSVVRSGHM